jgi:hypothetical protein
MIRYFAVDALPDIMVDADDFLLYLLKIFGGIGEPVIYLSIKTYNFMFILFAEYICSRKWHKPNLLYITSTTI